MELSHRPHVDSQQDQQHQSTSTSGADGVSISVRADPAHSPTAAAAASDGDDLIAAASVGRSGKRSFFHDCVVRPVKLAARSAELIIWILLLVFVVFVLLRHRRPPTQVQPWNRWVPAKSPAEKFDEETRARRSALGLGPPVGSPETNAGNSHRKQPTSRSSDLYEDLGWHGDRDFLDQHDASATSPSGHAGEVDVEHSMPEWKRRSLGRDGDYEGAPREGDDDAVEARGRWRTSYGDDDRAVRDGRAPLSEDHDGRRRRYRDGYDEAHDGGGADVGDDDLYPYSSWETPSPPRTRPPLSIADIKRQIRRLEMNEEFSLVQLRLKELEELKKQRMRILDEYDFGDEQDAFREKEREWQRIKWNEMEKKFQRWIDRTRRESRRGQSELQDGGTAVRKLAPAGEFREEGDESCPDLEPAHTFVPYGQQLQSIPDSSNAYVTYVSSAEFVPAAATLMFSIAASGSQYARAICITEDISTRDRDTLSMLGQLIVIDKIPSPRYIDNARYRETFTKLRIWQLAMFRRVLYIDTDVIVTRNMDDLFDIAEWAVPMDAEQNRYSTGMMVCEPSLRTFDTMEKELQTTTTSMELPDLLFLKAYFDNPSHNRKINIIPRWYQVYQEEFGSQYSTYLTNRKQKLTIFDSRIHGIHYPGAGKPWGGYVTKVAKYRPHFCHWRSAEVFQYEPQFLWYVYHDMMLRALARTKPSSLFDYEHGANLIVLRKWVEEKKHDEEEAEKNRNRWNTDYGRSPQRATSPRGDNGAPSVNDFEWKYEGGKWIKVFSNGRNTGDAAGSSPGGAKGNVPAPAAADPLRVFNPTPGACRFLVTIDLPHALVAPSEATAGVGPLAVSDNTVWSGETTSLRSLASQLASDNTHKTSVERTSNGDDSSVSDPGIRQPSEGFWGSQQKATDPLEGTSKLSNRKPYRSAGDDDDKNAEDVDAAESTNDDKDKDDDDDTAPEEDFQQILYNDDGVAFDGQAMDSDQQQDELRDEDRVGDGETVPRRPRREDVDGRVALDMGGTDGDIDEEQLLDMENRMRKRGPKAQSDFEAYQDAYDRHENPYRRTAQRRLSAILGDASVATEHVSGSAVRSAANRRRGSVAGSRDGVASEASNRRSSAGAFEMRSASSTRESDSKKSSNNHEPVGSQPLPSAGRGKTDDAQSSLASPPVTTKKSRRAIEDQGEIPGSTTAAPPIVGSRDATTGGRNADEGDEEFVSRLDKLVESLDHRQDAASGTGAQLPPLSDDKPLQPASQRPLAEVVPGAAIDFSLVPPLVVALPQAWADTELETYEWVISWCSKTKIRSMRSSSCGKPAHVSQYSLGLCRSNFDESFQVLPLYHRHHRHHFYDARRDDGAPVISWLDQSSTAHPRTSRSSSWDQQVADYIEPFPAEFQVRRNVSGIAGVVFRSKVTVDGPTRAKWFEVLVRCDATMVPHTAALDTGTDLRFPQLVVVNTSHAPHDRRYQLRLRSRCACLGGCDSMLRSSSAVKVAALRSPRSTSISSDGAASSATTSPGAIVPEAVTNSAQSRYVSRLFEAWKRRVIGTGRVPVTDRCNRRMDRRRCEGSLAVQQPERPTLCLWDDVKGQCVANTAHQWVLVHTAEAKQYCNCTHVGGDAERRRPATFESCATEALAAGANVINYVGDETRPVEPTVPDTSSASSSPTSFVRRTYERNPQARTVVAGPSTATPVTAAVKRTPLACFYKKCSTSSLFTGLIPTATYRPGSASDTFTGFDVYFLNPLYQPNAQNSTAATSELVRRGDTASPRKRGTAETSALSAAETRGAGATQRPSMFGNGP